MLRNHFENFDALHSEFQGDLGLSGGYDSRLLLACADPFLTTPVTFHTHATGNGHDKEREVAEKMAELGGSPIHLLPTSRLEELDDERLEHVVSDGLYLFDARSAANSLSKSSC